jgi:hypothetical protein
MFSNAEFEKLKSICEERKITPEKLLEEKFAPLQKKISKSQGELIVALTRDYKQYSHGMTPIHYFLNETLYAGIITPRTKFPIKGYPFEFFLLGINKPHSLEIDISWEKDFKKRDDERFGNSRIGYLNLLYFMDKSPEIPDDSWEHGGFGSYSTVFPTEKPRLELYIGDQQSIPFLQQNLEGGKYLQLAKLLEYDLPVTDNMQKKVRYEQSRIFNDIE